MYMLIHRHKNPSRPMERKGKEEEEDGLEREGDMFRDKLEQTSLAAEVNQQLMSQRLSVWVCEYLHGWLKARSTPFTSSACSRDAWGWTRARRTIWTGFEESTLTDDVQISLGLSTSRWRRRKKEACYRKRDYVDHHLEKKVTGRKTSQGLWTTSIISRECEHARTDTQ